MMIIWPKVASVRVTAPWSPIQLWKKHPVATVAGFIWPLLVWSLIVLPQLQIWARIVDVLLLGAFIAIIFFGWGLALAHFLAGRRWIVASLIFLLPFSIGLLD